ncbi:MAG: hypothetical protein R3Y23_04290 [Bacillota bacterium]
MPLDYMENLAREYNKSLQGSDDLSILIDCKEIIIRQIELLSVFYASNANQAEVLSYVRSLKETALQLIQTLIARIEVPKPRAITSIRYPQSKIMPAIIKLEIELFTNLDILLQNGGDVVHLIENEDRFAAFLGLL